jgi:16S rRNA (uracil1498-N3)-methyltransferase
MPARRFFVDGARSAGQTVALDPRDAHKIANVLRLRDGDRIEVVDAAGQAYGARLRFVSGAPGAELLERLERSPEVALRVDIAQGIPKGAKMDFVIEKATELGASAIVPFYSQRSVVRDVGEAKLDRWRRLAKAAAAQSDRSDIPVIAEPVPFDALLELFAEYDAVLMPWEEAERRPLRESLPGWLAGASRLLVLIGPEGGFAAEEAARAVDRGARLVSLGDRILRSETAALAMLALIWYASEM